LNFGTFSGLRLRASAMGPLVGLDLGGFLLERRSGGDFIAADMPTTPNGTDGGFPFLARPFFDVNANRENAYFISVPTFTSGSTRVSEQVAIFGYDVNATVRLACWDNVEIIGFIGHRFLGLNENLDFNDRIVSLADQPAEVAIFYAGQPVFRNGVVSITDSFHTSNRFYGGQLGSQTRVTLSDLLSLSFRGSVALGVNQQLAEVQGVTSLKPAPTDPDQTPRSTVGGIYAQPTNIGSYFRSVFSYASEGEVNLEYAITPNLTARAGYSILYWTNVVRPGNLIDRRVDRRGVPSDPSYVATPVPPVEVPVFAFKNSDIWVQGLTFGLELHY